jgi:hypothetical protein
MRACSVALSVVHDVLGLRHPIAEELRVALGGTSSHRLRAALEALLDIEATGALGNQRLAIAGELEGSVLDVASQQVSLAEKETAKARAVIHRAIAAFMAGAALEDALRRLCDANGIEYDAEHATIQKLQGLLYQPSKGVEVISTSELKQITAWGDTRNLAAHGKFDEIGQADVVTMVIGVRAFIGKHMS